MSFWKTDLLNEKYSKLVFITVSITTFRESHNESLAQSLKWADKDKASTTLPEEKVLPKLKLQSKCAQNCYLRMKNKIGKEKQHLPLFEHNLFKNTKFSFSQLILWLFLMVSVMSLYKLLLPLHTVDCNKDADHNFHNSFGINPFFPHSIHFPYVTLKFLKNLMPYPTF